MTVVSVMRDRYVQGWPAHEKGDRVYVLPLGDALERSYSTDAHFVQYVTPNGRRLTRGAIDAGVTIEIPVVFADFDCAESHKTGEPAPESWRRETRSKVCKLFDAEGAGYYYETRGGARVIYRQEEPTIIQSQDDAREWSQNYAIVIANLKRRFDLDADPGCNDWQRLFRAPRATRTPGGKPENWPTFGDAHDIADLFIEATPEDVATAKRSTTAFRKSRAVEPSSPGVGGDGLFFHALRLRGHVGREAPRGGWICLCPNRNQHGHDSDWTDTTIVVPPDAGHELGLVLCRHAHCWERFTVKQWLAMFSDAELDAAREAAGIKRRNAA